MKKILLITNMFPSNQYPHYGIFVKHCADILSTAGHHVTVVSISKCDSKLKKIVSYGWFNLRSIFCGLFGGYDVIYAHYSSHTAYPLLAINKINKKCPIVMNVHGNDVVPDCTQDEKNVKRSSKILRKCSIIVCPSNYFKKKLMENYGILRKNIVVYPSGGVDCEKFRKIDREKALKRLSLTPSYKYIGYVSRIEEKKGWDIFLRACEPLVNKHPEIRLVVVGDGAQKLEYENLVEQLKLKEKIVYFPLLSQGELLYIYNALELFVFPTYRKSESLGLVGLEAMACECLVLASDQYGPASYLCNDINGYSFRTEDAMDAKIKMERIIFGESEETKSSIKKRARNTAQQYSSNQTRHILVDLFFNLMNNRNVSDTGLGG